MKLHCIVEDLETARTAVAGGATVIQLRRNDLDTLALVEFGRPFVRLCSDAGIPLVVNNDVTAALALNATGVHLGRSDEGKELARAARLMLGVSATSIYEAIAGEEQDATYIGAGPIWPTATKPDASAPIGLDGLAAICEAVQIPVVAIGGIDASNARDCMNAGARGVAVVRASRDARAVRDAIDAHSF